MVCPGAYKLICTLLPLTSLEMILRVPFGSRRSSLVHPPALGFLEIVQVLIDVPSNLHRDGSALAGNPGNPIQLIVAKSTNVSFSVLRVMRVLPLEVTSHKLRNWLA